MRLTVKHISDMILYHHERVQRPAAENTRAELSRLIRFQVMLFFFSLSFTSVSCFILVCNAATVHSSLTYYTCALLSPRPVLCGYSLPALCLLCRFVFVSPPRRKYSSIPPGDSLF